MVATELGLEVARAGNEVHFVGNAVPFRLQGMGGANGPYFHQASSFAYALFDQPFPELTAANALTEVIQEYGVQLTHAHYAIRMPPPPCTPAASPARPGSSPPCTAPM